MIRFRSSTDPTQSSGITGPARKLLKLRLRRLADSTKRTSPSRITSTTTETNGSPLISRRSLTTGFSEETTSRSAPAPPVAAAGPTAYCPALLGEQCRHQRRIAGAAQAYRHPLGPAVEQALRLDRKVRDIVLIEMDRCCQRLKTGDMVGQLALHRVRQSPRRLGEQAFDLACCWRSNRNTIALEKTSAAAGQSRLTR